MKHLTPILIFLAGLPILAQAETFDLATFAPPRGRKVEYRADSVGYIHTDEAAETFCVLGIYNSTASSGNAADDYAREWEALLRRTFSTGPAPRSTRGRTPSGLGYLEGGASAVQGNIRSWAHLMVFQAGDRALSILHPGHGPSRFGRTPGCGADLSG